jgi:hypothetical protein
VYNWTYQSLGDINTGTWSSSSGVGRKADDLALQKKNIVANSKEVKTRSNLAESSKEGYGSKTAVLPTTMILYKYNYLTYTGIL